MVNAVCDHSVCFRPRYLCSRLYVSPKFPPTPIHKKITPREWLSEGHSKNIDNVPSLDDVRKSLIKDIDEAENLSDVPSHSSS